MKEEEIVCIDLAVLFNYLNNWGSEDYVYTDFNHFIRREKNVSNKGCDYLDYYDLYKTDVSSLRLCCDGEQCKVLNKTDKYVELIDVENIDNEELEGIDTTFKLSIDEYNVATCNRR